MKTRHIDGLSVGRETEQDLPQTEAEVALHVDRGPDWLFIRLNADEARGGTGSGVVDQVWDQLERHFIFRLVLEMDDLEQVDRELVGQLLQLNHRVHDRGGTMRLSGLGDAALRTLKGHLPSYPDRHAAVLGDPDTKTGPLQEQPVPGGSAGSS